MFTKGTFGGVLGHGNLITQQTHRLYFWNWWLIPFGQTLANAAKEYSLARSDVELGQFNGATGFRPDTGRRCSSGLALRRSLRLDIPE